jgi:hypothetical protein
MIKRMIGKENEFIVHLTIEHAYSAMLTYLSKYLEINMNNMSIELLCLDDLICILKSTPSTTIS